MPNIYLQKTCPMCKKDHTIMVDIEHYALYNKGTLTQDAFPSPIYTATERESIISGLCPQCQKKIFD